MRGLAALLKAPWLPWAALAAAVALPLGAGARASPATGGPDGVAATSLQPAATSASPAEASWKIPRGV